MLCDIVIIINMCSQILFRLPCFTNHAILNFRVPLYVSACFNNRGPCKKTGRGFIG